MDHMEITPHLRDQKRNTLRKKGQYPLYGFFVSLVLLVLIFSGYYFGLFKSSFKSPETLLSEAVGMITTNAGAQGTAFLVSNEFLITARHVVESINKGDQVTIDFVRKGIVTTNALLEWREETAPSDPLDYFMSDIAVIRLTKPEEVENIRPLTLGTSEGIALLTEVIVAGYPDGDFSLTDGAINSDNIEGKSLFKIDAASNPGNSGGPVVLKSDFSVIGVLVGGKEGYQGENVANKIDNVLLLTQGRGITF